MERFLQFTYLVAGQLADFIGNLAQAAAQNGHEGKQFCLPVPCRMPGGSGRRKFKPLGKFLQEHKALTFKGGHGADAAKKLTDQYAFHAFMETFTVAYHLVQPNSDLQAKGSRQGMLTMGAPDDYHVPVLPGEADQFLNNLTEVPLNKGQDLFYLK